MNTFTASAWRNGKTDRATYGFRIGAARDEALEGRPQTVTLHLEGGPQIEVTLHDSFWRRCPEFRHPDIRAWLSKRKLLSWTKGSPHRFTLERTSKNVFTVRRS